MRVRWWAGIQVGSSGLRAVGRQVSPEMMIGWAARWISDADRARRCRDEWLWDLAELRELDGQRACWGYAVSQLRGVWLMGQGQAELRRASLVVVGQVGAWVLGAVGSVLAVAQPSSPMMMMAMVMTLPFAIGSGLILATGLGVATLVGILRVTQVLVRLPSGARAVLSGSAGAGAAAMSTRGGG